MTTLIIESDLSEQEFQVLIDEVTQLHRDIFKKPLTIVNEQPKTREQIIREVANYIAPYSETAAQMALEVIAK